MARNFSDWLTAYVNYARNEYAPEHFTLWTGLSVLAGALERKVWIPEGNYANYPNLFVLLVSGPGIGKSSAIRQGTPLLYGVQEMNPHFRLLEGVTTAAGLREKLFVLTPTAKQTGSSIFLVGREGSDSPLKNHGDDFRSMACSMYDCEDRYQFTLKDRSFDIPKPVMNMIVGVTFDFLGSVIDQNSVFGGLASRFTYVIEKKNELKGSFFGAVEIAGEVPLEIKETGDPLVKARLTDDVKKIHQLSGSFRIKRDVISIVEKWHEDFKGEFNGMESERMRSLMIRKRTLVKKLLMLVSISEGDDLLITPEHAERAITLADEVTKDNPYVLSQSAISDIHGQRGTTQFIAQMIKRFGGKISRHKLQSLTLAQGNDVERLTKTVDYMVGSGWIKVHLDGSMELLVDPDRYL